MVPRALPAQCPCACQTEPAPGRTAVINTVFAQETTDVAHAQWRTVANQLRERLPKLAAMMDKAKRDVLAFMDFPRARRAQIHSTIRSIDSAPRSNGGLT